MRFVRPALLLLPSILFSVSVAAQPPQRDPQAIAVLSHALAAMGGTVPADSVATGTVEVTAGSRRETGTVRILTRSVDQTAEFSVISSQRLGLVYSRGRAAEVRGSSVRPIQRELAVRSEGHSFPLVVIARSLNDPTVALQYVGLESIEGAAAHHLRTWRTFPGNPRLAHLGELSRRDLWIDAAGGNLRKLQFDRRASRAFPPGPGVEILFSDYRRVNGLLYPFLIQQSINAEPAATITIQSVAFATGLSDADFPLR